jgi:hypothetical protein
MLWTIAVIFFLIWAVMNAFRKSQPAPSNHADNHTSDRVNQEQPELDQCVSGHKSR